MARSKKIFAGKSKPCSEILENFIMYNLLRIKYKKITIFILKNLTLLKTYR